MSVNLQAFAGAATPVVALSTSDEERTIKLVIESFPDRIIHLIGASGGLQRVSIAKEALFYQPLAACDYPNALKAITAPDGPPQIKGEPPREQGYRPDDQILIMLDWQHVCRNPGSYRMIKQYFPILKAHASMVILIAPNWDLPPEIDHDIPVVDLPLPTREELRAALNIVIESSDVAVENPEAVLDAATGLTLGQAEQSFTMALVETDRIDPYRILEEKMRVVKQSGYMEWIQPASPESLGGLGALKQYFWDEVIPVAHDPLLRVRGVLTLGPGGGGKSHASKVAGSLLGWPVIAVDISAMKGSKVGESEANLRRGLKIAEAVAPCILRFDEIEKAVAGYGGTNDSVTSGMIGTLLTWMQDHMFPILIFAACNDYTKLPPELARPGRIDERFFVDFPSFAERVEIATIHLTRFSLPASLAEGIANLSADWTGAEIEGLIKSVRRRTIGSVATMGSVQQVAPNIKPISVVSKKEMDALKDWGRSNLRLANTPEVARVAASTPTRRISRTKAEIIN